MLPKIAILSKNLLLLNNMDKKHEIQEISFLSLLFTFVYGAIIYYFYALNFFSIALILILSVLSAYFIKKYWLKDDPDLDILLKEELKRNNRLINFWPLIIYLLFFTLSFFLLYKNQSDRALISPFEIIGSNFFIAYLLSATGLFLVLRKKGFSCFSKLFCLSTFYFLSFSLTAILYKIAYGYDPFIHQATMELIAKEGAVYPKPFYYLGQYSFLIIIHKISGLSLYFLNKFLVPIAAAIILPWSIWKLSLLNKLKHLSKLDSKAIYLSIFFLLIIGFSPFIITTPQSLSYLFLILTIVLGLTKKSLIWPLSASLATIAIHPLSGLPALIWTIFLFLEKRKEKIKRSSYQIIKYTLLFIGSLVLPVALLLSGENNLKNLTLRNNWLPNFINNFQLANSENWLLNLTYFIGHNYSFWLFLLVTISFVLYRRYFKSLLFINISLFVSFLLSNQITFNNVISYEQNNFADRIPVLITLFSLPLIILLFNKLISLILKKDRLTQLIWLVFAFIFLAISLYISYPRFDNYFNSRGYSTGKHDLEAVHLIDEWSEKPYIVLANQQVSAAALKEFGFDNYRGKFFFYPIPTGGELYKYYLKMVYEKPSRETMAEAMELSGVSEAYLVINKYWHQSEMVRKEAELQANEFKNINNEVYIFKYSLN